MKLLQWRLFSVIYWRDEERSITLNYRPAAFDMTGWQPFCSYLARPFSKKTGERAEHGRVAGRKKGHITNTTDAAAATTIFSFFLVVIVGR